MADLADLAFGDGHLCGLHKNGTISCLGHNEAGQLGDGSTANRLAPVAATGIADAVDIGTCHDATYALRPDGSVLYWGGEWNDWDQTYYDVAVTPTSLPALASVTKLGPCSAIAQGSAFELRTFTAEAWHGALQDVKTFASPCALRTDGTVTCVDGDLAPHVSDGNALVGVTDLASTKFTACAVVDGHVECWDSNFYGELGDGTCASAAGRTRVVGLTNIVQIATAPVSARFCALRSDGAVWCWGRNDYSEVGDGTNEGRSTPVRVW